MRIKGAFTWVEMCVVLALLVLLSAILFTVFARVRETGRQSTCQNNLRQIHMAVAQYVADNDSHLPQIAHWKEAITPFSRSSQTFLCPSINRPFDNDDGNDYGLSLGWLNTVTFTQSKDGKLTPKAVGINEATLTNVSEIPLSLDASNSGDYKEVPLPRGAACGLLAVDGKPEVTTAWPIIHNGGFNIIFYDGHVKWMSPEQGSAMECDIAPYAQPPFYSTHSQSPNSK